MINRTSLSDLNDCFGVVTANGIGTSNDEDGLNCIFFAGCSGDVSCSIMGAGEAETFVALGGTEEDMLLFAEDTDTYSHIYVPYISYSIAK